jgi:hypothetical protein
MRKTVIGAAAAATVAVTGLAFGQERQSGQEQKPAPSQMERGEPSQRATGKEGAAAPAQRRMGEERQGQGGKMDANAEERGNEAAGHRQGESQTAPHEGQAGMPSNQLQGQSNKTKTQSNKTKTQKEQTGEAEGHTSTTAGTNGGAATVEASGNAHLSNEQASRIADTLWTTASPAQTSVNIDVNVGEPLPGNVELMPLPPTVVSIVPEYRDYDYVVVHDEIIIVQPSTRKVVEVIRRGGETHAMREGVGHGHRLTLSQSQQRLIRESVTRDHLPAAQVQEQLSYGVAVPQDVTLEPVPQPLIVQIPIIEQYRMFITGDDRIVLVDPDTREVVDVIE